MLFRSSDMTISSGNGASTYCKGLFGSISTGAVIGGLTVKGNITLPQHSDGEKYIGAVIGYVKDGNISQLSADINITMSCSSDSKGEVYIGGAIGKSEMVIYSSQIPSCNPQVDLGVIAGESYFYLGHKAGWLVSESRTRSLNYPYNRDDTAFSLSFDVDYSSDNCYINGYQ